MDEESVLLVQERLCRQTPSHQRSIYQERRSGRHHAESLCGRKVVSFKCVEAELGSGEASELPKREV